MTIGCDDVPGATRRCVLMGLSANYPCYVGFRGRQIQPVSETPGPSKRSDPRIDGSLKGGNYLYTRACDTRQSEAVEILTVGRQTLGELAIPELRWSCLP